MEQLLKNIQIIRNRKRKIEELTGKNKHRVIQYLDEAFPPKVVLETIEEAHGNGI